MISQVAVVGCSSYGAEELYSAVERGLELLGGLHRYVKAGETIVLKPNLLAGDALPRPTATHPLFFGAVARVLLDHGVRVQYGDSPGKGKPERIAAMTGHKAVADALGVPLADFITPVKVSCPGALLAGQLSLAAGLLAADGMISLPKMKTHGFTRITGAVKNQFGCLPGLQKAEFHVKMPDIFDFCRVLTDINMVVRPRLYIMDGIVAMEGNGPRSGEPVPMNLILFSRDPVALDAVFCRLIHLNPEFPPTAHIGRDAGLGTWRADEIELLGDPLPPLINPHFDVVRRPADRLASAKFFPPFLKRFIAPRPVIDYSRCIRCGCCIVQCPVKPTAIDWAKTGASTGFPVYDYDRCIRCYCCQELCPEKAVLIKTPPLGKIIRRF